MNTIRSCKVCALPEETKQKCAELSVRKAAAISGVSFSVWQNHRSKKHSGVLPAKPAPKAKAEAKLASFKVDDSGTATVTTKPTTEPQDAAFKATFERFGHDPDKWTLSRNSFSQLENAEGVVQTWYKATFTPKTKSLAAEVDVEALRKKLWRKPPAVKPVQEEAVSFLVCLADLQLGKAEGGGVEATVERFKNSVVEAVARYRQLVKQGRHFEQIVIAQMGDPIEGCANNYGNQTFTVELNQREQLTLALELFTWAIREFRRLNRVQFVSVHSNHGEWSRNGSSRSITDESDTADAFIGDTLALVFAGDTDTAFVTPKDEAVIPLQLSGIPAVFTHAHKAPSAAQLEKWLDDSSRDLIYTQNFKPELWITAHYHHFKASDLGAYTYFQCPSSDGGSQWFRTLKGRWSRAGVLTLTVGASLSGGWDDLRIV